MNAGRMTSCQLTVAPEGRSEAHPRVTRGSSDHEPSHWNSPCELACCQLTANLSQACFPHAQRCLLRARAGRFLFPLRTESKVEVRKDSASNVNILDFEGSGFVLYPRVP